MHILIYSYVLKNCVNVLQNYWFIKFNTFFVEGIRGFYSPVYNGIVSDAAFLYIRHVCLNLCLILAISMYVLQRKNLVITFNLIT
jgi:hypothetical protein